MMMINEYLVPSNNFSPTFQHSTVPFDSNSGTTCMQIQMSTLTRIYDPGIVSNNTKLVTINKNLIRIIFPLSL